LTPGQELQSGAWIVDASVAVKWFLPVAREREGDLAREAIGRLAMRTSTLAVYEVGNVLRAHSGWEGDRIGSALDLLLELCGDPLGLLPEDFEVAADLSLEHGLTFYDATYVAIAHRMGRGVLSADGDLLGPGLAVNLQTALA
jgi:predicted nucleic acid-binding protein